MTRGWKPVSLTVGLLCLQVGVIQVSFLLGQRMAERPNGSAPVATSPSGMTLERPVSPQRQRQLRDRQAQAQVASVMQGAKGSFRQRIEAWVEEVDVMNDKDVLGALKALKHRPEGTDRLLAEQVLLARYAELDPETALTYVDGLRGQRYDMGRQTVMRAWATSDPEAASAYVDREGDWLPLPDDVWRSTAAMVAGEWAGQDVGAAMEWVASLPTELQGDAYRRMAAQAVVEDPASAVNLLASVPHGVDRQEMLQAMVGQWVEVESEAAGAWVMGLNEVDQQVALPEMTRAWMQTDPRGASEWLAQIPAGRAKDEAIMVMTTSPTLVRDPEAAMAWSAVIQDPTMRTEALQQVASRWEAMDPHALQAWMGGGSAGK